METTTMLRALDFSTHTVSDVNHGFQLIHQDLQQVARRQLKHALQESVMMDFEQHMQYRRHERSANRRDYRNGYRRRSLYTSFGVIKDIKVPRSRYKMFVPGAFERYKQVHGTVNNGILKRGYRPAKLQMFSRRFWALLFRLHMFREWQRSLIVR
jgi:transposase-like protein